jgi:uncharacterized protein (TIGR00369 family)
MAVERAAGAPSDGEVAPNPGYRAEIVRAFEASPFLVDNGIRFVDCGPGWCEAAITMTPRHLQHTGVPHAGGIATLADHTAGGAAMSLAPPGHFVLTTNLNVSLLRGIAAKRLVCRAEVVKAGRQVSFAESTVEAELASGEKKLVARASVTLSVLRIERARSSSTTSQETR